MLGGCIQVHRNYLELYCNFAVGDSFVNNSTENVKQPRRSKSESNADNAGCLVYLKVSDMFVVTHEVYATQAYVRYLMSHQQIPNKLPIVYLGRA
jgi:hypothetical protein